MKDEIRKNLKVRSQRKSPTEYLKHLNKRKARHDKGRKRGGGGGGKKKKTKNKTKKKKKKEKRRRGRRGGGGGGGGGWGGGAHYKIAPYMIKQLNRSDYIVCS